MRLDLDGLFKPLDTHEAAAFTAERDALLAEMGAHLQRSAHGTKLHIGALAPGCERCVQGQWSCLFISSKCNADCFFCPGEMDREGVPAHAERVVFEDAPTYAAYLKKLGFGGASVSGGEPFLSMDAVVETVRTAREALGADFHLWLYTNGKAATSAKLARLAEAGLNELRFNIVAADYSLKHVARAIDLVETVTIEIPAIPEDEERLKALLPDIAALGVQHLNLHQLMILGDNAVALVQRGYRFTQGMTPSVVESELAALRVLAHAVRAGITLPISQCSTAYKEQWQCKTEDRRAAATVLLPQEWLGEAALVERCLVETGAVERVRQLLGEEAVAGGGLVSLEDALRCPEEVGFSLQTFKVVLGEAETHLEDSLDLRTIKVTPGKSVAFRFIPVTYLRPVQRDELQARVLARRAR